MTMPARAYWKGYLRLSLVTIGIELYPATASTKSIPLHQIDRKSGKRIKYEKVVPGGHGAVKQTDIIKGYEVSKGNYVTLEPEELDEIKLESRRTIDLVQFVDHCEIDPRYFEKPYYVIPTAEDVAAEGFAVIREALKGAEKVGLGQMATRGKDQICAVKSCGDGILLETLRYEQEIRDSDAVFDKIPNKKIDKEMMSLASELIKRKTAPFHPEKFHSHYNKALKDLIQEKRKKGEVTPAEDEEIHPGKGGGNVIDLMEALRKSVKGGKAAAAPPTRRKAPAKKTKAPARKTAAKAAHKKAG
jgi:DNA end-binding protein Ku